MIQWRTKWGAGTTNSLECAGMLIAISDRTYVSSDAKYHLDNSMLDIQIMKLETPTLKLLITVGTPPKIIRYMLENPPLQLIDMVEPTILVVDSPTNIW